MSTQAVNAVGEMDTGESSEPTEVQTQAEAWWTGGLPYAAVYSPTA